MDRLAPESAEHYPPGGARRSDSHKRPGRLLVAAGLGAIGKGVTDLGAGNLTPFAAPVEGNELKTTGAFSYVRHPIYGGLLVAATGLGQCINQIDATCGHC